MSYKIDKVVLKNGLTIYYTKTQSEDISILANVNAGLLYENNKILGISHFIEHMFFKGTDKRLSRDSIYNEINFFGGHNFCHTSKINIPLGLTIVPADFEQALDFLSDLLFHSKMDKLMIEKEKAH